MNETYHYIVSGDVQGVGYRVAVRRHAQQIGIKGMVRNLPDGNVDIIAQGTQENLKAFLEKIEKEPGAGYVKNIQAGKLTTSQIYHDFTIEKV